MYFVVFVPNIQQNRVVKANWIRNLPIVNMLKHSLNHNIKHWIFWSRHDDDVADFSIPLGHQNSERACFIGYLVKCFGTKRSALEFAKKRRANQPPVYNKMRPYEYSTDVTTITFETEHEVTDVRVVRLLQLVKELNEKLGTEDLTIETDDDVTVETDEEADEEAPVCDHYDEVFGSKSYKKNAIGGYVFMPSDITIRSSIMELLRKWNASSIYSMAKYDYQFVQFLLLEAFGTNEMALGNLSDIKLDFVRDLFRIRVKNDDNRLGKFQRMVEQKCEDCKKKLIV